MNFRTLLATLLLSSSISHAYDLKLTAPAGVGNETLQYVCYTYSKFAFYVAKDHRDTGERKQLTIERITWTKTPAERVPLQSHMVDVVNQIWELPTVSASDIQRFYHDQCIQHNGLTEHFSRLETVIGETLNKR